jgi:hypothetical protein
VTRSSVKAVQKSRKEEANVFGLAEQFDKKREASDDRQDY